MRVCKTWGSLTVPNRDKRIPKSREQAEALMIGRDNPCRIGSGRSTRIEREIKQGKIGDIRLWLYQTAIVTWKPDGSVVLDSGGWKTVTTKARMNEAGVC